MTMRTGIAVFVLASAIAVGANSTTTSEIPAEDPPSDFAGRQFVDSQGCVFIRAIVGDEIAWVPRLNRDREVLCGFEPTFAANEADAPQGSLPTVQLEASPDVDTQAAEALPAPTPLAEESTETSTIVGATVPSTRPSPRQAVAAPEQVAQVFEQPPTRVVRTPRPQTLPNSSLSSQKYQPVWDDDRLNPNRGPRTAEGTAAMHRIWSFTVPMRSFSR